MGASDRPLSLILLLYFSLLVRSLLGRDRIWTASLKCLYLGDIRSRLIRLIPHSPKNSPLDRIRALLAYRFPSSYTEKEASYAWRDIVEGSSALWKGIPNDRKETIRGTQITMIIATVY